MRRLLSAIAGIVLAVLLSQFPEYAQQYTQRLGGAVDELRIITERFDREATEAGLSREAGLETYAGSGNDFLTGQGRSMAETFARYAELKATLAEVEGATGWRRFALLPGYLDTEIGARTLEAFRPAVPVTAEGLVYAGIGFILGYFATSGIVRLIWLALRGTRRRYET